MKKKLSFLIFTILLIGFSESIMIYFFLLSHRLIQQVSIVAFIILFIMWGFLLYRDIPNKK
jgi:hypothetical protein